MLTDDEIINAITNAQAGHTVRGTLLSIGRAVEQSVLGKLGIQPPARCQHVRNCRSPLICGAAGKCAKVTDGVLECCHRTSPDAPHARWCPAHGEGAAGVAAVAPAGERCPDCFGSEFPGFKRGVRCKTCNGTATKPEPASGVTGPDHQTFPR